MENEEVEKILEESAQKTPVRDFGEIWKDIGPVIEEEQKKKKESKKSKFFKRQLPVIASICLLIACVVVLPLTLFIDREPQYFIDELGMYIVTEEDFYEEIREARIGHVDFTDYYIESYTLLQTKDMKTVGGVIDVLDDEVAPTKFFKIQFFVSSVKLADNNVYNNLNLSYITNGASIQYQLKSTDGEGDETTYEYTIKATQHRITYLIEYVSFDDNITEFFDEFFS